MNYSKINNITGWLCFAVATLTYILTLEPSVSFWDCGEFIASALKMQVVHQPGAPLFLMIQRFFSLFAFGDLSKVAYFMNVGSAIASAATILFLFWTITALAKKVLVQQAEEVSKANLITIMGAGLVGALAYTFSDSFWFSAVESEVYALSSLFTAIVFWAILKWEAVADEPRADRWLLFIAYIMGLSIGIHLLNLLTIPAIAFVYYFKKTKNPTTSGTIKAGLVGILILAVIQYGIIQYLVSFGAYFDLFFVNTLGMGFGTGVIFFAIILIGALVWGIRYSIKHQKKILNLALLSTVLIIFGYGSFAMIIIRAKADPNLNNSDPDNAFSFLGYLNREQYGDRPLLFGPNYNSQPTEYKEGKTLYRKGAEKYEVAGTKTETVYDRTTPFPRMYSDDARHVGYYKDMMGFDDTHFPNLIDNIGFFFSYQIGQMYMRYFMWNFVGRQNDDQGQGSIYEGQWLSGVKPIDAIRLGDQSHLPPSITDSNAYNRFFFLPLIIGLMGAIWHFKRNQKDAGIVALLFFFTGIAIVLYLNQKPLEPRERDYAYAGSFYAFAIWVGFGVLAIREWIFKKLTPATAAVLATVIGLFAAPVIMAAQGWDDHDRSTKFVARDIAIDYLQSCAPNAILFTYGDNDTYPLWYAQEVENIRPDIRLVNLSLFDTDWYINGMKRVQNGSAPLPLSMNESQYVQGVRDVMYYQDYKIAGSVELKNIVDLLLSDNDEDKLPLEGGKRVNFIPTKNFKLTVNKADVIKNNVVAAADSAKIAPELQWTFNKNYVTKGTLAMLDILAHNNWKRPIYFASTVPSDQYNGLDNYLYNEGLALRLIPLKTDTATKTELINTPALYNNLMNKFVWGNVKNARYLDTQSSDDISIFTNVFNNAITGLLREGKTAEAKKVADRYFEVMPDRFYGLRSMMGVYFMAENLYYLNETKKANELIEKSAAYIKKELTYLADVSQSKNKFVGGQNVQLGMSFLNQMARTTAEHKQTKLTESLNAEFAALESRFSRYFAPN
ncbi:glycosyltransferase family 117 protein [Pedobacter sp. GR22-6]|uniref:glycosyltransferase family 117 protein n=1 Tax=Pedobacter sp. GR22-6 TaxID=3127957 RepID=UPI00307FCD6D